MDDNSNYEYDVAISYASEDREYAEALADVLHSRGVNIFYDKYERAVLWGEDLYTKLSDIYLKKARYCIVFLSKHYVNKVWTKHELQSAQDRALQDQNAYILPIRLDNTKTPGVLPTIAYLDWDKETPEIIADLIVKKLKRVSEAASVFAEKLNKDSIFDFINTSTSKVILVLSYLNYLHMKKKTDSKSLNFEGEVTLKLLEREIEKNGYLPVMCDLAKTPRATIFNLAHLSHFIVIDLSNCINKAYELHDIIANCLVPIQPIASLRPQWFIDKEQDRYELSCFGDLEKRFHWIFSPLRYQKPSELLVLFKERLPQIEKKTQELEIERNHFSIEECM